MKNLICAVLIIALFSSCDKKEDNPTACFTYTHNYTSNLSPMPNKDSIVFTNCSENATSYLWNFGDGTTSTEQNPIKIYDAGLPVVVSLTAYNGSNSHVLTDTILDWAIVYKPNIYIYPENAISLCVSLNFPQGGQVVTSIPEYNNEWCVTVEPSGLINGLYDFLFYESAQPNIWQKDAGWVIATNKLESFFKENMAQYGFNANEIDDFIEYWIPLLSKSEYYTIFPQTKPIIDQVIGLDFSITPQNLNRLFYVIEVANEKFSVAEPVIKPFNKTGYYVNEWGVIL